MKIKNILLLTILSFLLSQNLFSEKKITEYDLFSIKPEVGYSFLFHNTDIKIFDTLADCGRFKSGTGNGLFFGLTIDKEIYKKFRISLSANYLSTSNTLSFDTNYAARPGNNEIYFLKNLDTASYININTTTYIDSKINFFILNPAILYEVTKKLINGPFYVHLGMELLFPVSNSHERYEQIVNPDYAVFKINNKFTQSRPIKNKGSLDILNSPIITLNAGVENLLRVANNKWFTQKISFNYTLNNYLQSNEDWKSYSINLSLGLKFDLKGEDVEIIPEKKPEIKDTIIPIVKKEPPKADPVYDMNYTGFSGEILSGDEYLSTLPLVNAVFFDQNSSIIPSKYFTSKVEIKSLYYGDAVDLHRYNMVRISDIIKANPNSSIVLEGATSGKSYEKDGLELAKNRVNSVKKVLVSLGIDSKKIKETYYEFPKVQSNQEHLGGVEENQRVTIYLEKAPLQEYVSLLKFSILEGKLGFNVISANLLPNDKLSLSNDLPDTNFILTNNSFDLKVKKRLENQSSPILVNSKLYLNNASKKDYSYTIKTSKLNTKNIDRSFDNFNAVIRFDYNSSKLTDDNQNLIRQLVDILPENATIEIYGSADALGTEQRNQTLTKERAEQTEAFIRKITNKKLNYIVAESKDKFTENTPEGRFLNRSIRIKIKK
jgi:outer membrane protein OmpA-like peptidoglycan-associated protein